MHLYNITFNIEESIESDWTKWAISLDPKTIGCCSVRLLKVLVKEDMGGVTYSMQLEFNSPEERLQFSNTAVHGLYETINKRFGGKWLSFATELHQLSFKS